MLKLYILFPFPRFSSSSTDMENESRSSSEDNSLDAQGKALRHKDVSEKSGDFKIHLLSCFSFLSHCRVHKCSILLT